jgi:predicted Zn-dependent protease
MRNWLVVLAFLIFSPAAPAQSIQPRLDLKQLAEPLQNLTPMERQTVDKCIKLIQEKQHVQALALLTELTVTNPMNSAVRVLRAYVLLELGNLTGALGDARTAEDSGPHSAYRCWFLAQVAFLAGDKPLCKREIKHLSGNTTYAPEVKQLTQDLKNMPPPQAARP